MTRHPTTATWSFPPAVRADVGARRVNLREIAARPGRFEHHLTVVGSIGVAQLEVVTASEPLFFAHANISDEYALALPTGDAMIDAFPTLTFISDPDTGTDLGRVRHRSGQLVLHPHGLLHWPGRLRPPHVMPDLPGPRRTGLSLVICANQPTIPATRPLLVTSGLEDQVKAYTDRALPFVLADLSRQPPRQVAVVGSTQVELLVSPSRIGGGLGGYLVILEAEPPWFATDLVFIEPGVIIETTGVARALWISGDDVADAPPASWEEVPAPSMACFEDRDRVELPRVFDGIAVASISDDVVRVDIGGATAEVPRYWLARMLFRLALHGFRLGYLETYGGFYYDDRDGYRLGLRGGGALTLARGELEVVVDQLYRAVAPPGYTERLS